MLHNILIFFVGRRSKNKTKKIKRQTVCKPSTGQFETAAQSSKILHNGGPADLVKSYTRFLVRTLNENLYNK